MEEEWEVVTEDEEVEELIEEAEEVIEVAEERYEEVGKPEGSEESSFLTPAYVLSLSNWYSKLLELKRLLEMELTMSKGPEREAIEHEISEVEKEIRYVRWKLVEGLNAYRAQCDRRCKKCPLELLCKELPRSAPRAKGAEEPWLIASLMHKYRLL